MKKIIITIAAAISMVAAATVSSKIVDSRSNGSTIGVSGKIVAASLGSTVTNGQFRLEIGRQFDFGSTVISSRRVVFGGTYSSNVSNVTFSAPIYVSPSDRMYCSGVNATNFTAQAVLFIEQ